LKNPGYLLLLILCITSCTNQSPDIKVSLYQEQVPVLIGKNNNPVLRLKLEKPDYLETVILKAITISLNGTDDLTDIKTVRIFYLGEIKNYENDIKKIQFGKDLNPDKLVLFEGNQKLDCKKNYFWVSFELSEKANLHHKVDVGCLKILLADGTTVKLNIKSPPIKQRIGVAVRKHMDDDVHTYRIPGLAITNNGTLLGIYDVRRNSSRDLQGDIDIGLSRSVDGGRSWEPMQIVLDMGEWGGLPQKFNGASDGCILVDKNSDNIFIAGLWMHGVLDSNGQWIKGLTETSEEWEHQWKRRGSQPGFGVKQTTQFLITKSSDDGKTWGKPINITRATKNPAWWLWAPAPGRGITLEDGTLLFPTQGRDSTGNAFSNIMFSKDGGKHWEKSKAAYSGTNENMVVQLSDESLMINMRDGTNRNNDSDTNGRAIAITDDMGETWTEHPTSHGALVESACMACLHKHNYTKNGKKKHILLFSNPNTKKRRHHTTIKVSFDDGKTWPEKYWLLLDAGKNKGYSCMTSIDENTIGILYEGSQADMTFESIPLKELIGNYY
jgi:sialidase-1